VQVKIVLPTAFLLKEASMPVTSIDTGPRPATAIMANIPPASSPVPDNAAKYVERNGFWLRQPNGISTSAESTSTRRTRTPQKSRVGSLNR